MIWDLLKQEAIDLCDLTNSVQVQSEHYYKLTKASIHYQNKGMLIIFNLILKLYKIDLNVKTVKVIRTGKKRNSLPTTT